MSMIVGKFESKAKHGGGVKVGGKWYNGPKEEIAKLDWDTHKGLDVTLTLGDDGKITAITLPSSGGASSEGAPSGAFGGGDRQRSIIHQSSLKAAIETATLLVNSGAVKLPSAQNAQYDAIQALISELTCKYFNEVMAVSEGAMIEEALDL